MSSHTAARRRPIVRARRQTIRWDRLGRAALLVVLVAILALYISPLKSYLTRSQDASERTAEVRDLERENARLEARARALQRPDALEREARRLGMVRRGERAYVIENVPSR